MNSPELVESFDQRIISAGDGIINKIIDIEQEFQKRAVPPGAIDVVPESPSDKESFDMKPEVLRELTGQHIETV